MQTCIYKKKTKKSTSIIHFFKINLFNLIYFCFSAGISDGGARHSFNHKGVILANFKDSSVTLETCLDHAIEAGAEDVIWDEEHKAFNVSNTNNTINIPN